MQKLACLKAKKPRAQRKVASAQQWQMQKLSMYVETENLQKKTQAAAHIQYTNSQSQTSHVYSGGTVLGQTRQRSEG